MISNKEIGLNTMMYKKQIGKKKEIKKKKFNFVSNDFKNVLNFPSLSKVDLSIRLNDSFA